MRKIKSRRLVWLGHAERKEEECNVKIITNWKLIVNRPRGRTKMKQLDDVKQDFRTMKVNWEMFAWDRVKWKKTVELAKTHIKIMELSRNKLMI